MLAMCTKCYRVYPECELEPDHDFYQIALCNNKKCKGSVCEVDDLILPAIVTLNKKGYHTHYCCSGHLWGSQGYIRFYVYFKDGCLPNNIPEMFKVDTDSFSESLVIRYKTDKFNSANKLKRYKQILEINLAFYEWVNKLPKNENIQTSCL
jgi:hypothetical protein